MTSQLNVDTIADKAGSGPVGLHKQHAAKAWLSFDADTSNDVDDSFNHSSTLDNAAGDYTHSWTNACEGATYSFQVTCTNDASGAVGYVYGYTGATACRTNRTASTHRVTDGYAADGNNSDMKMYCYTWHGDLA